MSSKYFLILFLLISSFIYSQTDQSLIKEGAPNIYFDCGLCDMNYIKEKVTLVNYVLDRKDADVHVLFTSQTNGSGGTSYTLYFIGQNNYAGINDTVNYSVNQTDSQDISREKMVDALKIGLVKYISRSKVADQMKISYNTPKSNPGEQKDDWDFWLFKTNMVGNFNGDKNYKYLYLYGSVSANRTTEDLKVSFQVSSSYNQNKYAYVEDSTEMSILSITRSQYFNGYVVKAIDGNWSWGIWYGLSSSIYNNIDYGVYAAPGIEYDIFPYSVSNEKQLRINYKLTHTYNKYDEETWYYKTGEHLWSQNLEVDLTLIKQWGNISLSSYASDYLHDLKLYEFGINGSLSLNLVKGLSLSFYGGYSKIADQISLRLAGASLEDVLTQRRQLETNYSYWGGFGISYSFGSIYNNIVNPRFGSGGGNTMIISF